MLRPSTIRGFQKAVTDYYGAHGRHNLPWRQPEPNGRFDPYKILVSEIMLQQTQVNRVIHKYTEFLAAFPTLEALAAAQLGQVITIWSGLGYNRRAKYLHETAKGLTVQKGFPDTIAELVKLPGVGKNTAGAVVAYAFNRPALFIETNIRTAYIHHFFADKVDIPDSAIIALLEQTLTKGRPREFYWALMDYGSHLKNTMGNLNKLSKSYTKQSAFLGSKRQIRGQVLRALATSPLSQNQLGITDERLPVVLDELVKEGLIQERDGIYSL